MKKSRIIILALLLLSVFCVGAAPALAGESSQSDADMGNSCSPDDSNCTGNPGAWSEDGTPGWSEDGMPGWSQPEGSSVNSVVALIGTVVRLQFPMLLPVRVDE